MINLVLVRHGQSEWNKLNQFTGWRDVALTEEGVHEAEQAAEVIRSHKMSFDQAFTSDLSRAHHTLEIILEKLGQQKVPVEKNQALNERDYGDLTGMNKDEARRRFGEDQVHAWRRSYDLAPPGGESLKDTEDRVWPYFVDRVLPEIQANKQIIISAHGNSLRALVKRLEDLSPDEIMKTEIATGVPIFYALDENGAVIKKWVAEAA